jgi:hypothetical protein
MRTIKNRIIKKKYTLKKIGGEKTLTEIIDEAVPILPGSNTMPEGELKTKIIAGTIPALRVYQNKSTVINDFIRQELSDFSAMDISDITEPDFMDDMAQTVRETVEEIMELDSLFQDETTPFFNEKTVLYRGTQKHYPEQISRAFISTTKTIDHLFHMMKNGDDFLSDKTQCCLNVLLIDPKYRIPYLDLEVSESENPDSKWGYQQEVLLPRGLKPVLIGEYMYPYDGIDYKTYVYEIKVVKGKKYKKPEHIIDQTDLVVDNKEVVFLTTTQKEQINNLQTYMAEMDSSNQEEMQDLYGEFQSMEEFMYDINSKGMMYFCTTKYYKKECSVILTQIKNIIDLFLTNNNLRKPECKTILIAIKKKVDKMLKKREYITRTNFIEIPRLDH